MYRPAEPFVLAVFLTAHPRVASVSLWVVTELAMRTALASSPVRFAYSLLLPQPSPTTDRWELPGARTALALMKPLARMSVLLRYQ